jgi:hypothetical protein
MSYFLSDDLPLGSPINPVAPPNNTIGLYPIILCINYERILFTSKSEVV